MIKRSLFVSLVFVGVFSCVCFAEEPYSYAPESEYEESLFGDETEAETEEETEAEIQRETELWDVELPQETEIIDGVVFTKEGASDINKDLDVDGLNNSLARLWNSRVNAYNVNNIPYDFEDVSQITNKTSRIDVEGNATTTKKDAKKYSLSVREIATFNNIKSDWVNVGKPEGFEYTPYLDITFYFGNNYIDTWILTTDYDVVTTDGDVWVSYGFAYQDWFKEIEKNYNISQESYLLEEYQE